MNHDDLRKISADITGGDGTIIWPKFLLAIEAFTRWPVDAFATEVPRGELHTLYWIKGNLLGRLTAEGDSDAPHVSGSAFSISSIQAVELGAKIVDTHDLGLGKARRSITIKVGSGNDITIDVAKCKNDHCRERTDGFIDKLLASIEQQRRPG